MLNLPYSIYAGVIDSDQRIRTLIENDCRLALDFDDSYTYWSDLEAAELAEQLYNNIGNGSAVESIGLDPDADETTRSGGWDGFNLGVSDGDSEVD